MLLIIDDAEHADIESIQAISTLVRHQRELAVLVVLAMATRSSRSADLAVETLELTGLSERAVAALAAARGRTLHPSVVSALTKHTSGNPRDVLALLDEVPDSIWSQPDVVLPAPRHLRAQTRDCLADCTPDGRALVEALAILGEDGALADASALAGLVDPLPGLDSATAAGLLIAATPFEPRLRDSSTRAAVIDADGRDGDRRRAPAGRRHRHRPGRTARSSRGGDADTGCRTRPTTSYGWRMTGAPKAPGRRRRRCSATPPG